jgi:two-component system response regulator VicR
MSMSLAAEAAHPVGPLMTQRLLIIEDNRNLSRGLRHNFELEGFDVDVCYDGASGLAAARAGGVGLIILDLMIPRPDGYRVLQLLREEGIQTPVIVVTARGEEADKLRGFRLGADDYVTKPFSVLELIARASALLRRTQASLRSGSAPGLTAIEFGAVRIEPETHSVYRHGEPVPLRPKEFQLLMALVRRGGRVATRTELLDEVWGYDADVVSRTVDTHIGELRRKLEDDPSAPRHLLTVRKTGYRLVR